MKNTEPVINGLSYTLKNTKTVINGLSIRGVKGLEVMGGLVTVTLIYTEKYT